MIIRFPSPVQEFDVTREVPKNEPTRYARVNGHVLGGWFFTSPIDLRAGDHVWIDVRTSQIQIIARGGIAIWRIGWQN